MSYEVAYRAVNLCLYNYGKEKKRTLYFASFCLTMGLNHRKSMSVSKLCEKSIKFDIAGQWSL